MNPLQLALYEWEFIVKPLFHCLYLPSSVGILWNLSVFSHFIKYLGRSCWRWRKICNVLWSLFSSRSSMTSGRIAEICFFLKAKKNSLFSNVCTKFSIKREKNKHVGLFQIQALAAWVAVKYSIFCIICESQLLAI